MNSKMNGRFRIPLTVFMLSTHFVDVCITLNFMFRIPLAVFMLSTALGFPKTPPAHSASFPTLLPEAFYMETVASRTNNPPTPTPPGGGR